MSKNTPHILNTTVISKLDATCRLDLILPIVVRASETIQIGLACGSYILYTHESNRISISTYAYPNYDKSKDMFWVFLIKRDDSVWVRYKNNKSTLIPDDNELVKYIHKISNNYLKRILVQ